jgi:hypothetical protein
VNQPQDTIRQTGGRREFLRKLDWDMEKGIRLVPAGKGRQEVLIPWHGAGDTARLWANFLDCVKSRQRPFSPIDIAVRVQAPLNMGILSHRESKVAKFDTARQQIVLG